MTNGARAVIAIAGAAVTGAAPILWWWHPLLLCPASVLVAAWIVWLVLEYLHWARSLRQR